MSTLHLALHGLDKLDQRLRDEIIYYLKHDFEPIVVEAGKHLRLTVGKQRGDLNLDFDTHTPASKRCSVQVLGEDGGEAVFVNAHRNLGVCSAADPRTGKRDKRRLLTRPWLMGRALANTAIHELGHYIALLDDILDEKNFMMTLGPKPERRTLRGQREAFAGHKTFTEKQRAQLVTQLRKGEWLGEITFH